MNLHLKELSQEISILIPDVVLLLVLRFVRDGNHQTWIYKSSASE